MVDLYNSLEEVMLAPVIGQAPSTAHCGGRLRSENEFGGSHVSEDAPSPAPPTDDESVMETRSMRSESVASTSRSSNRLSLTIPIPIALPSAPSSRPTPTSSNMASYPLTPLDTPALLSPVDPNEFITAIAAQERRVLELREELSRAESELNNLKRQWTTSEAHKKHAQLRNAEPLRPLAPHIDTPEDPAARRSTELDRRKALLLGQQSQQNTPTHHQYRRRVFRGGHTRTLSLLSPTKPSTDGFDVHEDNNARPTGAEHWKPARRDIEPSSGTGYTTIYPTLISKRASWAPRSVHQQTSSGVKQIAEDLKTGLWTFMEDLRQATVGDEPITGQGNYLRGIDGNMRSTTATTANRERAAGDENQQTIRASTSSARPHASSLFDYSDETPTPASRFVDVTDGKDEQEKENSDPPAPALRQSSSSSSSQKMSALTKNQKRFSWTPLTIDSYDDNDWSSWDSPTVKSPRWSGSTINGDVIAEGAGSDENAPLSQKADKPPTSPKKKPSKSRLGPQFTTPSTPSAPSSSSGAANKLVDDLLPPVLNRLTPLSNLKKTAADFMKEWEKSLSPPRHSSLEEAETQAGGGGGEAAGAEVA